MATVNFSVPDDVKVAFDKAFVGQNKSAIIADLMRGAVAKAELTQRRQKLFREVTEGRGLRPTVTIEQIRAAREAGRS